MSCARCGRPFGSQLNHTKWCIYHVPGLPVPVRTRTRTRSGSVVKHVRNHPESDYVKSFQALYGARRNY